MQKSQTFFSTNYEDIIAKINSIHPGQYTKTRNFINGDITYLSPYISRGVISTKQIMHIVLNNGFTFLESEKLIQELAWREYYQRVWQEKKELIWDDLKQAQPDFIHAKMPTSLLNCNTGIKVIDENINHLYEYGYLHNHIRMYIASMACNVGKAQWKIPAKWFYYHLLDGDIASNNCSWQWVAGSFSSKKYYCNQENINKYTNTNQRGTFLDKSYDDIASIQVPEALTANTLLQLDTNLPNTELPILDITKPTLIYNFYNLDPSWRANENVNRVLLLEPTHFASNPVSEKVINFALALSKNIPTIQVFTGEITSIIALYNESHILIKDAIISKEHPAFTHYPGIKDQRDWMFPNVTGYYPSFFNFWKKCTKTLQALPS
jgi:deoxyribodipyrimidine photo-lyase